MEMERRIRPELEGLRAIAAILVAVYHIWFNRVSGEVDVFFVVSGFLITTSLLSMYHKNGKLLYFSYIVKLLKRLLPTAWLIGVISLIISFFLLPAFVKIQNINEFLASAFYFQNWRLAIDSVDYLAQNNSASPFQHFWALSTQFQFYLIWLVVFFVAISAIRLFSFKNKKPVLISLIAILSVVSLGYSVYLTEVNQPVAYYHTFARVWEFGIGGILALTIHKIVISNKVARLFGWSGLIGLISCGIIFQVSDLFPGFAALWPVFSAVLIILAGNFSTSYSAYNVLSWKPLVKFGSISYAFYLWHWPVLIFYYAYFDVKSVSVLSGFIILALSAALAFLTIYKYEIPIRNTQLSVRKTASMIAAASILIASSTFFYQDRVAQGDESSQAAILFEGGLQGHPGASVYFENGILATVNEFEEAFQPGLSIARQDLADIYEDGCLVGDGSVNARSCQYGIEENYTYTIALVGGSHAAHWQPMLSELAEKHNLRIVTYIKGNCRFSVEATSDYTECNEWFADVKEKLVIESPDLIFTVGDVGSPKSDFDEVSSGFVEAWSYFEEHQIPLFLVRDTPWYEENVLNCINDNLENVEECKADREDVIRDPSPLSVAEEYIPENATTIDLTDYFCDEDYCYYIVGNVITHFDSNHLTATFSRSFAPVFEEPILQALYDSE